MKLQKETEEVPGVHGRWYGDACGSAFAMELIGERWSLLVVRELMLGARRFSDLRAGLPGISAKVLTERLTSLEAAGVLAKRTLPPPGKAQVYELTDWGYAAEPVLQETGRWAARSGAHDPTLPLSAASLMMSMRTMVDHAGLVDFAGKQIGFVVGDECFVAEPEELALPIRRCGTAVGDAIFRAPTASGIAAGFYADIPWNELERAMGVLIEGDRDLALRFAMLLSLPDKLA